MTDTNDVHVRNAAFRREALHALSTPLGGLLLQAELVEQYVRQHKLEKATEAVTAFLQHFDGYARSLRDVFAAIDDVSEVGDVGADLAVCLRTALDQLGDVALDIAFLGESHPVAVPAAVLTTVMRRIALQALALNIEGAALSAERSDGCLRVTLSGTPCKVPAVGTRPFHPREGLDLWIARELLSRYGASLDIVDTGKAVLVMVIPVTET